MDTFNPFGDNIPIKRKLRNTYGVIKEIWFHKNTTIMKKEFLKTRETFKEYKLNNDRDGWTFKDQN